MTDRELLELAAKAAGMTRKWAPTNEASEPIHANIAPLETFVIWNPLTDDGDAFRLAVKLGMSLVIGCHGFEGKTSWVRCGMTERSEYHNDDTYAATRRAIVRAAAEIGKGME